MRHFETLSVVKSNKKGENFNTSTDGAVFAPYCCRKKFQSILYAVEYSQIFSPKKDRDFFNSLFAYNFITI